MSYRITYDPSRKNKFHTGKPKLFSTILLLVIIATATISIFGDQIVSLLLPGDPQVTAAALNTLSDSLQDGDTLHAAITAFCEHIIDNAH